MKKYLITIVTNDKGMFIFDTYDDYIIDAETPKGAEELAKTVPYFVDTASWPMEISKQSAEALTSINRTKSFGINITKLIQF